MCFAPAPGKPGVLNSQSVCFDLLAQKLACLTDGILTDDLERRVMAVVPEAGQHLLVGSKLRRELKAQLEKGRVWDELWALGLLELREELGLPAEQVACGQGGEDDKITIVVAEEEEEEKQEEEEEGRRQQQQQGDEAEHGQGSSRRGSWKTRGWAGRA